MMLGSLHTLLVLVALYYTGVFANPLPLEARGTPFSLTITGRLKNSGFGTIADADRARIAAMRDHTNEVGAGNVTRRAGHIVNAANGFVDYTASVGVGTPPTMYTLIVDTGSSNTWIGAGKKYVKTSSSKTTPDYFSVQYGSGSVAGKEYKDTVTLSKDLVIQSQSIGVATSSQGITGVDGILGIGPVGLTVGTLYPGYNKAIPTVTDKLFSQGKIQSNLVSVFFQPTIKANVPGQLDFGGVDGSKITKPVFYTPITTTFPSSEYWGIDQTLVYNGKQIMKKSAGIVDTGTTLVYIPSDAFAAYKTATGAVPDAATGLLKISAANFAKLKNLEFVIKGQKFSFTPNAQLWPRALNTLIGGSGNARYLIVADSGVPSGSGLDFVIGYTWHQRFYTVYDTAKKQLGFAPTQFTTATTN